MIDAALDGRLKALVVVGYDILLTNPNMARTRRALEALDLLVVIDVFQTETASLAHVFLPAATSFEKDGTFMNAERRLQRVRKVLEPAGQSRSDAWIIRELAAAMGHGASFPSADAREIWNEVRAVWPDARGATYERLDRGGLQWPCPSEDHPGTPILYTGGFPGGRVSLRCLEYRPTEEVTDQMYPFLLNTGRTLQQFNAGTMTDRTPSHDLRPADTLDIAASDAAALGAADGDRMRVESRHGETVLPIRISSAVRSGELFATFHTARAAVNLLTSDRRDPVGTPEYKVTAVRLVVCPR
jgi:formate dehydrogenase major subunit